MPTTYEPIATTTLGSAQSSVTFSSITGTYTDLIVVARHKAASGSGDYLYITLNSDTGSNYSYTNLTGNGTSAASGRVSNLTAGGGGNANATTDAVTIINFQNYSNANTYKTFISRNSLSNQIVEATVTLWRNTNAITSILLSYYGNNFASGSTFTLYGIKAA